MSGGQCVVDGPVRNALRAQIATEAARLASVAEAAIGGPVVVVVLDPNDPAAASLCPALAVAYQGDQRRPSTTMVVTHGGHSVFAVSQHGVVCANSTVGPFAQASTCDNEPTLSA